MHTSTEYEVSPCQTLVEICELCELNYTYDSKVSHYET